MNSYIFNYGRSGISTSLIAIVIIIVVIIAGVGVYVATSGGDSTSNTSSISTTPSATQTTTTSTQASSTSSNSTSTATTTSNSSAQTTSSVASSTFSCSTTYTQSTGTSTTPFSGFEPLISLFGNYSQMSVIFNSSYTASYQVVGKPTLSGVIEYEVNYNSTLGGQKLTGTAYFLPNGTITQAVSSGTTMTGYESYLAYSAFTPFLIEASFASTAYFYTASSFVHVINETTIQLGPSSVSVTNYGATNLPFTVSQCGYTSTVNKLTLQIGHISGVSYNLLTFADFEGSSQGTSYAFVIQVTSVSK